ncbi:MAG: LysR family transcriptional regulator [Algicola sp.]|nr:LysR family transcriptional regulator [Algicola sp.]
MKNLPPLKALRVFLAAAQHQSFKAAAEQLFVTQAAVSQQIRQLEEHLQCQLFDRQSKQTSLTEEGQILFPYIERAFSQITCGVEALKTDPNPNLLRITSLHSFTSLFLIPKISDFQARYPKTMVQFAPSNQLVSFGQAELDIGIRLGKGDYPGLTAKKIADNPLVLVASPMLIKAGTNNVKEIFSHPLLEDTSSDTQAALAQCCERFGVDRSGLKSLIKVNDSVPLIDATLAGRGIAIVSRFLIADHLRRGQLINVLDYSFISPYSLYIVAPDQHFGWKKIAIFEQWFRGEFET